MEARAGRRRGRKGGDLERMVAGSRLLALERGDHREHDVGGRVELVAQAPDTQQRAQAGAQLDAVDRLVEEIVGAGFESLDFALGVGERGQHHDRDEEGAARRLQAPADLEAVEARHHDVEQDGVGAFPCHQLEGLLSVFGGEQPVAVVLQDRLGQHPVPSLVVDDQHRRRCLVHRGHRAHLCLDLRRKCLAFSVS